MYYAVIDAATGQLLSLGTTVADPLPYGLTAIPLDHVPDLLSKRWDPSARAFVALAPPKPRLRITANQTRIWESTPGQPPNPDQIVMLTGQLLDAQGQPDSTAALPETLIEVPGASGQPSLVLIRATAGVVEISLRGQWSPSIPFATEHSGRYAIADMLGAYFDVVDGPVIEVLRG